MLQHVYRTIFITVFRNELVNLNLYENECTNSAIYQSGYGSRGRNARTKSLPVLLKQGFGAGGAEGGRHDAPGQIAPTPSTQDDTKIDQFNVYCSLLLFEIEWKSSGGFCQIWVCSRVRERGSVCVCMCVHVTVCSCHKCSLTTHKTCMSQSN